MSTNQFALSSAQNIIHISEVERGLNCHCQCLVCGERMVAKKGDEREHHFAHGSNKTACEINHETVLHQFAKRVIQEAGGLTVPPVPKYRLSHPFLVSDTLPCWVQFDRIEEEKRLQTIKPDLIGYSGNTPVLIEVAYSSFVNAEKLTKINALDVHALEIDLRAFSPDNFDFELTKETILQGVEQKQWLFCPEPTQAPIQQEKVPSRETITIKGIWVYLWLLPSGDAVIKVSAFNPEVNAIVKGIAKRCSGYWQQHYKNWIVPKRCIEYAKTSLFEVASSR